MTPQARAHQHRALDQARVLDAMPRVAREVRRAQATRVFNEFKLMLATGAGAPRRER